MPSSRDVRLMRIPPCRLRGPQPPRSSNPARCLLRRRDIMGGMVGTRDASKSSGKIALRKEEAMHPNDNVEPRTRLVLVVGVDLSEVSPHLLATARSLVRSVDEAEMHVVHVVHSESVVQRLSEPPGSVGV